MKPIEKHPFPAILPAHATVMMMGTFPPTPEKRCMEFRLPSTSRAYPLSLSKKIDAYRQFFQLTGLL